MYTRFVKRFIDIILSLCALIILLPVYLVLFILVRVKLGKPAVFTQDRPGLHGKIFKLYKFRSMTDERDKNGELLPDEVRLTKFGRILRATSLDELPEFYNILKGDMSFVGPRPLLVRYLDRYNEEQAHRHDVLPGLTGLAQVNGRNAITWEKKFEYDVYYARNVSFLMDVKIVLMTVKKVFVREGISSGTHATMEEFMGSDPEKKEGL
ncbi:MAG: sugar transferase [Lachnospiraceae bacterium]|nr:sugar transferase [Lachnospiraceae bacterium]